LFKILCHSMKMNTYLLNELLCAPASLRRESRRYRTPARENRPRPTRTPARRKPQPVNASPRDGAIPGVACPPAHISAPVVHACAPVAGPGPRGRVVTPAGTHTAASTPRRRLEAGASPPPPPSRCQPLPPSPTDPHTPTYPTAMAELQDDHRPELIGLGKMAAEDSLSSLVSSEDYHLWSPVRTSQIWIQCIPKRLSLIQDQFLLLRCHITDKQ
jgi:hypothetical protein